MAPKDQAAAQAIPDVLLETDCISFVGTKGSGKTYTAKAAVERLIRRKARVCVIDPTGAWWGLRAGPDGAAAGGLDVTIYGATPRRKDRPTPDIIITDEDGGALGQVVAETDARCIVDLSAFGSGRARQRFMTPFLDKLYNTNLDPLHVIFDEADLWAPQKPMPEARVLGGLMNEIVRRGRVAGFVPWLISQRPAVIDKDVLSQSDAMVAMRLTSSHDRNAFLDWVKGQADLDEGRRIWAMLPTLPTGTGILWAPRHNVLARTQFPPITTFDSSATPERGEKRRHAQLKPMDAAEVIHLLELQRAKQRQREVGPRGKQPATAGPGKDALAAEYQRGWQAGRQALEQEINAQQDLLDRVGKQLMAVLGDITGHFHPPEQPRAPATAAPRAEPPAAPPRLPRPSPRPNGADGQLNAAARALLTVLAERAPARFTWSQVAVLAGLKPRGGHFNSGVKQLREMALIEEDANLVGATEAGTARLGIAPLPAGERTGAVIREMWASRLPSPAPDMLRALARQPMMSVAELAAQLDKRPIGGHWNSGMKMLRDNHLVTVNSGMVHLAAELRGQS